jgi:protein-disulfide isomerase
VFKNLVVHPDVVMPAHKAGCAAAKQQKFVPFKNAFWEKAFGPYAAARDPSKLGEANIMVIAKDLGLDTAKLKADMDGPECQASVNADMAELSKFHVNSTPTFFINGKKLVGGSIEDFDKAIEPLLKS